MISWQSIMSVFNTKGTLLKWLETLDQSLKDGVLESVTVNSVSEGVITLTFNFADGSTITTPQIDIPQGAQGPQGIPGANGANGKDGKSFNPMGEWVADNEYHPYDYVTYQGSSYLCTETIIDGTDAPPLDTAHWQLVAEKGDQGAPGTSPDIPTPTTADNGKVLGVTNGAYALQAASGGGGTQLYEHTVTIDLYQLTCVSNINTEFATLSQVYSGLLSGTSFNNMGSAKLGAFICMYNNTGADKYVIVYTTNGQALEKVSYGVSYSVSDSVTPL